MYEEVYLPEAKHGYADALLRQPCSHGECGFCDRIEAEQKADYDSFYDAVKMNGSLECNLGAGSSQEMDIYA